MKLHKKSPTGRKWSRARPFSVLRRTRSTPVQKVDVEIGFPVHCTIVYLYTAKTDSPTQHPTSTRSFIWIAFAVSITTNLSYYGNCTSSNYSLAHCRHVVFAGTKTIGDDHDVDENKKPEWGGGEAFIPLMRNIWLVRLLWCGLHLTIWTGYCGRFCVWSLHILTFTSFLFWPLQYVSKSASVIRAALKEPAKRKAEAQEIFAYKSAVWENGVQSPKIEIGKAAP